MNNSESLENIREILSKLFESHYGVSPDKIDSLKGDASKRSIFRIHWEEGTVVGVFGPNTDENLAFLGFTNTFESLGLPVPEIVTVNEDSTCYLLEDLGDTTLFQLLQQEKEKNDGQFPVDAMIPYYESALEYLMEFQVRAANSIDYKLCYQTEVFDNAAWQIDHNYFLDSLVGQLLPDYKQIDLVKADLQRHRYLMEATPRDYFLYRDFQSRNIMVTDDGLKFIDYQSGRRGPIPYDVASLLYDAKADLPEEIRKELLDYFCFMMCSVIGGDTESYHEVYPSFALLRILQALGSYGNNGIINGNPSYLESIPYALKNVIYLLDNDQKLRYFSALKDLILKLYSEKPWEKYLQDK